VAAEVPTTEDSKTVNTDGANSASREPPIGLSSSKGTPENPSETNYRKCKRNHDCFERTGLAVNIALTVFTAAAAGFAGWLAWTTSAAVEDAHTAATHQYNAMEAQRGVMQRQLNEMQAEQRPWVAIAGEPPVKNVSGLVLTPNVITGKSAFTEFDLNVEVVGSFPAFNVVGMGVIMPWRGTPDILKRQRYFCDKGASSRPEKNGTRAQRTLFPKQVTSVHVFAAGFEDYWRWKSNLIVPAVVGCVLYREQSGAAHWTGFIFDLYKIGDDGKPAGFSVSDGVIPPQRLRYTPDMIGDGPAN
jgi:hypothetical protein